MVEQGGLGDRSPQRGPGARPRWGSGKYCAYKKWFLCISCLYVIAKTYSEIEKTYSYATRQAAMATLEMMYPAIKGSGLGSD